MVDVWCLPPEVGFVEDGVIHLSDGRAFDLSSVSGNGFNANRLGRINAAIQAELDSVTPISSLPLDDPERTMTAGQFTARYGARRFLDGSGNIVERTVRIFLTFENGQLVPHCEDVR